MTKPKLRAVAPPIYTVGSYQAEMSLGFLLGRCMNQIIDAIDANLADQGINSQHFGVLHAIYDGRAKNPSELARLRYQYSAAITYILDVLEKKNLLVRKRSVQDRRSVELELTAEGEALVRRCIPLVVDAQNKVLESLNTEEYGTLSALLRRIAD
jgi:DNA-binding MarR family transcriptional regulator